MAFLLFNTFFYTLLLFCAFVAFAQWRLSRDPVIPYYIGYLLCVFGHYFRQFWLDAVVLHDFPPLPDPPLHWGTPLSFAATACYLFFVWRVMFLPGAAPRRARLLTWAGGLYVGMIALHLWLQIAWGQPTAERVHHAARLLLFGPMIWMSVLLLRIARLPYQKLIVAGAAALTLGFFEAIATEMWPRKDLIQNVICGFYTPWGVFYWYHLKVGISVDTLLFSWAITLRQKIMLQPNPAALPTLAQPEGAQNIATENTASPPDEFMERLHLFLEEKMGDENLRIDDIAAAVFLSKSQTSRRIKQRTGLSTEQYLLRYRLRHATQLLLHTDRPIGEIAVQVGIKAVAHFSHAFKREFGQSPSEMRRAQRST